MLFPCYIYVHNKPQKCREHNRISSHTPGTPSSFLLLSELVSLSPLLPPVPKDDARAGQCQNKHNRADANQHPPHPTTVSSIISFSAFSWSISYWQHCLTNPFLPAFILVLCISISCLYQGLSPIYFNFLPAQLALFFSTSHRLFSPQCTSALFIIFAGVYEKQER